MAIYKVDYTIPINVIFELSKDSSKKMEFEKKFNLNDEIGEMTILINFLGENKLKITLKTSKFNKDFELAYDKFKYNMNIIKLSFFPDKEIGDFVILKLNLKFCREERGRKYYDNKDILCDLEAIIIGGERKILSDYMDYFDFNSMLNIVYGGYILIELNDNNIGNIIDDESDLESDYNELRDKFVSKLKKIGIDIPEKTPQNIKKIEDIINKINSRTVISPEDCIYLLISTIPKGFKDKNEYISNIPNLEMAINDMFRKYDDIDSL